MSAARPPRPTDLVALVTFDGVVRENQAVTRDRLGKAPGAPRPLSAAVEQWLHLGRRTWVSVQGRSIVGIATARELSAPTAWELDTLIDAGDDPGVLADLLRQAAEAAAGTKVTHVLLRTPSDAAAAQQAPRAGFAKALDERLWGGHLEIDATAEGVREWRESDELGCFQLYSRALPLAARSALAMTREEAAAVHERRWHEKGLSFVAEQEGRIAGLVQVARSGGQFSLMVEPGQPDVARALLATIAGRLGKTAVHRALVPTCGVDEERALSDAGLHPGNEFTLFCHRTARPVLDEAHAAVRAVAPGQVVG
ncbi:MAG: hypothetical protein EPO16_05685 [Dehalococcoidia bacterium]|nr:MAG: hypothetical protein EPO16_05685 [Dehalococcoidia bacterium]